MIQDKVNDLFDFFNGISNLENFEEQTTEELAKRLGLPLPDLLKSGVIRPATKNDVSGSQSFIISSLRYPNFAWLLPWLARYKCFLICIDHGDHVHCVHICVTCLDSWPGPGCYIHGSYYD